MTDTLDRKELSLRRLGDMPCFAVECFCVEFVQQVVAQMPGNVKAIMVGAEG
jgi:hypothetical protein